MKIFLVKYVDLDDDGVVCAFTDWDEATKYAKLLDDQEDEEAIGKGYESHLGFYVMEYDLYNTISEVDRE